MRNLREIFLVGFCVWLASCGGGAPAQPEGNPRPAISSLSPSNTVAGGADFTLTVNGSGFIAGSVVRWNGSSRTTSFVSTTQLTTAISASDIGAAGMAQVTVFNPAPGGGTSGASTFTIQNPTPTLTSISPDNTLAGTGGFLLTANGSNLLSTSEVRWNGSARPTTFLSSTQLQATIPPSDVTMGGTAQVTVFNPSPGGGASGPATFTVNNPAPALDSISPDNRAAGMGDFTLSVVGSNFVPNSAVRWNGDNRPTTFISSTELNAAIPASDIGGAGTPVVTVFNPSPGGGESNGAALFVFLNLITKDLVFDPFTQKILASLPSSAPMGNSIAIINPTTGILEGTVFIGSEPGKLALSGDGQFLYVALDGAAAVRQFDVPTQTPGIQFALGSDSFFGPMFAEDMVVIPGSNTALAVSRFFQGVSPRHAGVGIYDNGVKRTNTTQTHTGSNRIEPSASASRLYGYNNETTEFGFRRLTVDTNGVTEQDATGNLISGFGVDIEFAAGQV
ncbi:MAG: IPT/TIG domain-containing protein, partial [Candidatus Acidiferrales bacterium]